MCEKGAISALQGSPTFPNNGGEIIPSKGRRASACDAEASAWQQAEGLFHAAFARQDTAKQVWAAALSPSRTRGGGVTELRTHPRFAPLTGQLSAPEF